MASGPDQDSDAFLDEARRRTLELLSATARAKAQVVPAGYIETLEQSLTSTGATQDLMNTSVVPMIYERWWRPGLTRLAKGLKGPGTAEEMRIARLLMAISGGDKILDVACGPGNFSRSFAGASGPQGLVVGIDASSTMLSRACSDTAAARVPGLAYLSGDATDLPFEPGTFDSVCCFLALHLFSDPFAALSEAARVLVPGGRIAILTTVRRGITHPLAKPVAERLSGMRMFEADEITSALRMRGFSDVNQRLVGTFQIVGGRLAS